MRNFIYRLFFILILVSASYANPDWYSKLMKMKVLRSTVVDFEKEFSDASVRKSFNDGDVRYVLYKHVEGVFTVVYALKECTPNLQDVAEVQKDMILKISFAPKKKIKLSDLKFDRTQFEFAAKSHDPATHFISEKLGIDFSIISGKVQGVVLTSRLGEKLEDCF